MNKFTSYEECAKHQGIDPSFTPDLSSYPESERPLEEALFRWGVIRRAINGDWKPNLKDKTQYKYEPWVELCTDSSTETGFGLSLANYVYALTRARAGVGSRLSFETASAVLHALKHFPQYFIKVLIS